MPHLKFLIAIGAMILGTTFMPVKLLADLWWDANGATAGSSGDSCPDGNWEARIGRRVRLVRERRRIGSRAKRLFSLPARMGLGFTRSVFPRIRI